VNLRLCAASLRLLRATRRRHLRLIVFFEFKAVPFERKTLLLVRNNHADRKQ
jgi:hypothetical protein